MKTKIASFLVLLILLVGCATTSGYKETIHTWTSYKDVANWMERNFTYDHGRLRMLFQSPTPDQRSASQTFMIKSGVCKDAAIFCCDALNRINPNYRAKVIYLSKAVGLPHYVCSFEMDGKIYVMDYGTGSNRLNGVYGPYNSISEFKKYYKEYYPVFN